MSRNRAKTFINLFCEFDILKSVSPDSILGKKTKEQLLKMLIRYKRPLVSSGGAANKKEFINRCLLLKIFLSETKKIEIEHVQNTLTFFSVLHSSVPFLIANHFFASQIKTNCTTNF